MPADFVAHLLQQPLWVQIWVAWMGAVNLASLAFWSRPEARKVFAAFLGAFVLMNLLFAANGFNRLLGLAHVVLWTPLVIYLVRRSRTLEAETWYGMWVRALTVTNALSLVFDYVDVIRYVLGDRS